MSRHYGHGAGYSHEQPGYDASSYGQQPQQQQPQYSSQYPPPQPVAPSHHTQAAADPRNYRWWIPEDGIRRDVIQADIQRYLGPDALVKPGVGTGENEGRKGYWIAGYRTLTGAMITDLKTDSANFNASGARGSYSDSQVHQSRQYWGPTAGEQAAAAPVPAAVPYTTPVQQYAQHQASQAVQPQGYATAGQSYGGYAPPASTASPYGAAPTASSPAVSQSSYGSAPNYTYNSSTPSSTSTGYSHQSGHHSSDQSRVPRSQNQNPDPRAYSQTTSQSQYAAPAPSAPQPEMYLASDGRYYPVSSLPAASRRA